MRRIRCCRPIRVAEDGDASLWLLARVLTLAPSTLKLSVVIPVYNERATVQEILRRVGAAGSTLGDLELEIIAVDDRSNDGTREILEQAAREEPRLKVLTHDRNQGKGAALRTGFAQATGDIVLIQDADLEYDPAEYPKLLAPILDGRADVVFGSRFVGGEAHRVLYYWHSVGNRVITLFSNCLTNLNLTDVECCYKVFTRAALATITIEENQFGIEPELVAKVARWRGGASGEDRLRVYEVGVGYSGRTYAQGKKIGWRDGVHALWCIFKYNLTR